jgi:aminoglycoside phosphotransferase (APT) family kinase protein
LGIVDWEFCGPGDPAMDFATLLHLGPEFTSLVIEAFRAGGGPFGPEEDYRMRRLWQVREFYGVLYGVRFEDEAELADAVRKLRAGPILTRPEAPC